MCSKNIDKLKKRGYIYLHETDSGIYRLPKGNP